MEPITIVVDTREQTPWTFDGITTRKSGEDIVVPIKTVRRGLKTGDYTVEGYETRLAVERKSIPDIVGTITHHRGRFERELERGDRLEYFAVVIEGEWLDMLTWCRENTEMNPVSLDNSIHAFMQRYKARWYWRPTTWVAAKTAYKIFDRFMRDDEKKQKESARNG